jgi:hypothetical protein
MPAPSKMFRSPNERELQVLDLLARGYSHTEIGNRLSISRTAAVWRLTHLRDVWNLRTMWQLCILAGAMGWATVPHRKGQQERPMPRYGVSTTGDHKAVPQVRHPWKGDR